MSAAPQMTEDRKRVLAAIEDAEFWLTRHNLENNTARYCIRSLINALKLMLGLEVEDKP